MEGLSPFRRLQDGQSACPLMESVAPPRDQGVMWSPCQPGSSSVPQLEQRPPEARYIATRSAVLKRRRVERLASPREGGVESVTSATPTGCLATAPALAEARGFFVSLAVDVVGTLLLREPGSAPKNFDQRTLLCGESTLPTPHHPLQRLPSRSEERRVGKECRCRGVV